MVKQAFPADLCRALSGDRRRKAKEIHRVMWYLSKARRDAMARKLRRQGRNVTLSVHDGLVSPGQILDYAAVTGADPRRDSNCSNPFFRIGNARIYQLISG